MIAYSRCDDPGTMHRPPLEYASCAPPDRSSDRLTAGTSDANGAPARMIGRVRLAAKPGDPDTIADEADVAVDVNLSDVRESATLADYPGELELVLRLRITDKLNGTAAESGTMTDQTLRATVPCTVTAGDPAGSTCTLDTTLDTLIPGLAAERSRAIWAIGQAAVNDGGPDRDAETQDNTRFAVQGVFIP